MSTQIKSIIKKKFNRASISYDQHCAVQRAMSQSLKEMILSHYPKKKYTYITDLACGTGESTIALEKSFQYSICYAIDFSERALQLAKKKMNNKRNTQFILSDFDQPIFKKNTLDLIFCNMGLQWSKNLSETFSLLFSYLKPGGLLAFSTPILGNFSEIKEEHRLSLFSPDSISNLLEVNNFSIKDSTNKTILLSFKNNKELLYSLKHLGVNYNTKKMHNNLKKTPFDEFFYCKENTKLTYLIGTFLAEKKQ